MSRGPPPEKAIRLALPIAKARGFITFCRRERGSICDFIILCPGLTAVVRLGRTKRLHGSLADMEFQFAGAAAGLRTVPPDPARSCEIWACDYYDNIRFFRVERTGLTEMGINGKPLDGTGATEVAPPKVPVGGVGSA